MLDAELDPITDRGRINLVRLSKEGEQYLAGEFRLEAAPGHQLSKEEESYKAAITRVFEWLHIGVRNEKSMTPALVKSREDIRKIDQKNK